MSSAHMEQLQQQLMDTLADLRNRDNPMDIDRAKAVAHVASVLVDTAKVEVDYLKVTGQTHSPFIERPATYTQQIPGGNASPFPTSTTHRLK